jgi:hypothetical protein
MVPSLISVLKIPTLITEILLGRSTDIFLREYYRYTCGYLILYVTCLLCITTSLLLIITGICVNFTSLSTPRQCPGHGSTSCPRCMRPTHMNNSHFATDDFYRNRTQCIVAGSNGTNTTVDYLAKLILFDFNWWSVYIIQGLHQGLE